MTHYEISYKDRLTPAFDAVEDIKDWMGADRFSECTAELSKVVNQEHFEFYASLTGVQGYPVQAWYELIHGQGSWGVLNPEKLPIRRGWPVQLYLNWYEPVVVKLYYGWVP